jgi:hypothetical protein
MLLKTPRLALLAAMIVAPLVLGSSSALADKRPPSPEERGQIERVLRADGFTRWEEIKWEDGRWEVVAAVAADGRTFGLELSQIDFSIVRRNPKP